MSEVNNNVPATEEKRTRAVLTTKEKLTLSQVSIVEFALGKAVDTYAEEVAALKGAIEANPALNKTLSRFVEEFEAKALEAENLRSQIAAANYIQYAFDSK